MLLFGIAREIVGASTLLIADDEMPNTVAELKSELANKYPDFRRLTSVAVAVDSEYVDDATILSGSNEVAIIPPVSGG